MNGKLVAVALIGLMASGPSLAQVHAVTYSKNAQDPPKFVTLGGQSFALVRFAVRDFTVDKRYLVSYLAPIVDEDGNLATTGDITLLPTSLVTEHSNEALTSNITIDGYPGVLQLSDGRQYSMQSDFLGTDKQFDVEHTAVVFLRVKVGDMILNFQNFWDKLQQPVAGGDQDPGSLGYVNLGDSYNAYPAVRWGLYVDPTGLVGAADSWIDYITIKPLN